MSGQFRLEIDGTIPVVYPGLSMTLFVSTIFSDPSAQGHLLYDGNNGILPTLFPTGLCSSKACRKRSLSRHG